MRADAQRELNASALPRLSGLDVSRIVPIQRASSTIPDVRSTSERASLTKVSMRIGD